METSNAGFASASRQPADQSGAETVKSPWKSLYRVAGTAALVMAVLIPIQVVVFVVSPPPNTVIGFFTSPCVGEYR